MEVIIAVANWLSNNIFGTPAFLLMMVVLVGHLLQKSPVEKTVSGTLKAGIGFLVINAGSNVVTGALGVFEPMWAEVFGLPSETFSNCMGLHTVYNLVTKLFFIDHSFQQFLSFDLSSCFLSDLIL